MRSIETKDCIVTFDDSIVMKNEVFNKIIQWFLEKNEFSGEGIMQSDSCLIGAPNLLCDLADDILKFKVEYKD